MSVLEVIEAVKSMSPPERERVRTALDSLSDSGEETAMAKLRASGLLINVPSNPAGRSRVAPVEIKGKPLSHTVIEERR
ncbi:MAG: hypothetical protein ABSD20_17335 [Terriglobales bacterium]|jgi:hypothetical protein